MNYKRTQLSNSRKSGKQDMNKIRSSTKRQKSIRESGINSGVEEYNDRNRKYSKNFNIRHDQSEGRNCELEDRSFEIFQSEEKQGKNEIEESKPPGFTEYQDILILLH